MTGYYVVEEPDDFFPDDFGNDDAPVVKKLAALSADINWDEDADDFFADDFGNDDRVPRAPTGLSVRLHVA